jgi:hypothetical protein
LQAIASSGPARGAQITRIWAASVLIAWQARLERQSWMGQRPCARGNVAAGHDESTIVQLDEVAAPSCARLGADHYQDGRGVDLFTLAGPDVLQRQGLQAGLAVHVSVGPAMQHRSQGRAHRTRRLVTAAIIAPWPSPESWWDYE